MKKILILASNPRRDLKLDLEIQGLSDAIRRSHHSGQFNVQVQPAVRIDSLQEIMGYHNPRIVHFCGHGEGKQGLVLQDEANQEQFVPTNALAELFSIYARDVECVVLNACYSDVQAEVIVQYVDYVIGMRQEILDQTAIKFSKSFYRELGNGKSVEDAFRAGCNQIDLESGSQTPPAQRKATLVFPVHFNNANTSVTPEHLRPVLKKNPHTTLKTFSFSRHLTGEVWLQRSSNQQQVLKDVGGEVAARWGQSLYRSVLIPLNKQEQPNQVNRWNTQVKIGNKPPEALADNVTVTDVFFRDDVDGKLLILGTPGAGKTTAMLSLAADLLEFALTQDSRFPIPVILNLSSWKGHQRKGNLQSIPDWLVKELHRKYGIKPEVGQSWLEKHQILPLLDGLDEVEQRDLCIEQINQWLLHSDLRPSYLVVCSRATEYQEQGIKLALNSAVYLDALTDEQIQTFLTRVAHPELWQTLKQEPKLLQLVRTPLMLSILTLAYDEISTDQWKALASPDDRCKYLLEAYVRRMLEREVDAAQSHRGLAANPQQTQHWLGWLARQLEEQFQDEFLIEYMQPTLLGSKAQQRQYITIVSLIFGIVDGLLLGLLITPAIGVIVGIGVVLALMAEQGAGAGGISKIAVIESLRFSSLSKVLRAMRQSLKQSLQFGGAMGLLVGVITAFFDSPSLTEAGLSLTWGLIFGFASGLMFGLIDGLKADVETRKRPNQGIWNSATNVVILTLIAYPIGLFLDRCFALLFHQNISWLASALRGLAWAFIFSIGTSGKACVQHGVLRLFLYSNRSTPLNYARFLQSCTERSLLQQVGGRFRFVHKQLQEYFAKPRHSSPTVSVQSRSPTFGQQNESEPDS